MKKLLALLLASLLLSHALPTFAQNALTLGELQIDLWAEFDQPQMLVIYRGTLASNVTFPAALTFNLPLEIKPLAVAYKDDQDRLLDLQYTFNNGKLSFNAPTKYFQFEYYAPLDTTTPNRKFNFAVQVLYPIQKLALYAQQPPTAKNFVTTPTGESKIETNGLTYAISVKQNVPANELINLEITYTKNDALLTAPPAQPVTVPTATNTSAWPINETLLVSLVVALLVVVVFGGGIWYVRQNRQASYTAPTLRRVKEKGHPPKPKEINPTKSAETVAYCHECGEPATPADNFCRKCGTKIRR